MERQILLKRAYDKASRLDGFRVLVDRLWPRGTSKGELRFDVWAKELAPSDELRKWFGHDVARWPEFRRRYKAELTAAHASKRAAEIVAEAKGAAAITLVYGAKDSQHNQAVVLAPYFRRAARRHET